MTISLTTPLVIPAYAGKPAQTHAEVSITDFVIAVHRREVTIVCQYGNTIDGVWIGAAGIEPHQLLIANRGPHIGPGNVEVPDDPAFNVLMGTSLVPPGVEGMRIYDLVGGSLYQYLIDNVPEYAGVIT